MQVDLKEKIKATDCSRTQLYTILLKQYKVNQHTSQKRNK